MSCIAKPFEKIAVVDPMFETIMARWPDDTRTILFGMLLIFVVLPLLCGLAWWFVRG